MATLIWVLVFMFVLDGVLSIACIGVERGPISKAQAIFTVLLNAVLIYFLITFK